jgi:predicted small secreted protein
VNDRIGFPLAAPMARMFRSGGAAPKDQTHPMNRRIRGILTLAISLTLALAVAACSTTQSAGKQIDDTTIHAAVKAKLTADRFSNIVNIDINVTNGVVTLAGEVPNAKVSLDAQNEAHTVSGVVRVINNLQIKSPPSA